MRLSIIVKAVLALLLWVAIAPRACAAVVDAPIQLLSTQVMLPHRRAISSVSGGSSPSEINGIRYWWVASDLPSGSVTGLWSDRIQGFLFSQGASANQPFVDSADKSVVFQGNSWLTNNCLECVNESNIVYITSQQQGSFWLLMRPNYPVSFNGTAIGRRSLAYDGVEMMYTNTLSMTLGGTINSIGTWTNNELLELAANFTNASSPYTTTWFTNGVAAKTNSLNISTIFESMGYNSQNSSLFRGRVYEFACFSNVLSSADIALLHDYASGNYSTEIAGVAPHTNTAVFDGTNDYMTVTPTLTTPIVGYNGMVTGNKITFSTWLNVNGEAAQTNQMLFNVIDNDGNAGALYIRLLNRTVHVKGQRFSDKAVTLDLTSTNPVPTNAWFHLYGCFDLSDSAKRHIYYDSVDQGLTVTTYNNNSLWLNYAVNPPQTYQVGTYSSSHTLRYDGAMSDFWFACLYLDSPGSFSSGGSPANIGWDGAIPTGGVVPSIYLNGSGDEFRLNNGKGKSFTVTGSLGTTTPP